MKIAILSGKGGTGKTFVATNLAVTAQNATYIDCDVEEPNGRLFLKPQKCTHTKIFTELPEFNAEKCNGCRQCVDFCEFNALAFIKNKPLVFADVCHSCNGCELICKQQAVTKKQKEIGIVEQGYYKNVKVVTGILNIGEISGVPIIKEALKRSSADNNLTIIDCPPGSSCSVMETVMSADCCIMVIEPTIFGFHNFKMVYKLVKLLQKPCFAIINKADKKFLPLEYFCQENKLQIISQIPYNKNLATLLANSKIVCEVDDSYKKYFDAILKVIKAEVNL